jgi:DNA-binding transcriptional MerR regulator
MLAPQKNRAGQRTYRKRDVEMVLRIKELLYEDQYTIAGAKKRLTNELRGASKLKVVTPEMAAPTAAPEPAPPVVHAAPAPPAETYPQPFAAPAPAGPAAPAPELNDERRAALRRLAHQMRELLHLLDADDPRPGTRRP